VPFDPWSYDTDGDCYIGLQEALLAVSDYYADLITKEQVDQVTELWQNNIRNPACVAPPLTYHLEVYTVGDGTVTPGSDDYDAGAAVALTAVPDAGAVFDHWSGDATGTNPTISIIMDRDKAVTAHFTSEAPPPEIDYSGDNEWCAYRIYHGEGNPWTITETEGRIGNLSVELTKAGLAGVEATFTIFTGGESYSAGEYIALEVLGWWQYGKYLTGLCIYDYNKGGAVGAYVKKEIGPGEMLRYQVSINPRSGVLTRVWDSKGNLIFENYYECDAKRMATLQTELEYWRYFDKVGSEYVVRKGTFKFSGEVTLERIYCEGVGGKPADILSYYLDVVGVVGMCDPKVLMSYDHYTQDGCWVFKGEVKDD